VAADQPDGGRDEQHGQNQEPACLEDLHGPECTDTALMFSVVRNGAKSQPKSWPITNAAIVTTDPMTMSLATVQRTRPMPWVQT
jgi:hypothetical protein